MVQSDRASMNRHNLQLETLMIIRVNNTVIESEALEEATEAVGHAATWTGEKLMDFGKKLLTVRKATRADNRK